MGSDGTKNNYYYYYYWDMGYGILKRGTGDYAELLYNKCGDLVVILYYTVPTWVAEALTVYFSELRSVSSTRELICMLQMLKQLGTLVPLSSYDHIQRRLWRQAIFTRSTGDAQ